MRLKVIFGHPKWPPAAILLKKKEVAYWSEMARNVIKIDFRSSKMVAGSHFVTKNKSCVLIWNSEKCDRKWFSVIQNGGGGAYNGHAACKPFGDIHSICPWANTPILVYFVTVHIYAVKVWRCNKVDCIVL